MESLGRTLGQQRFQGFPSSALLSLAFQCIHVSGEPSFSSENKLLWEFLVHAVSFSHTASCLIILTLLTTDSGRILFSLQRKLSSRTGRCEGALGSRRQRNRKRWEHLEIFPF